MRSILARFVALTVGLLACAALSAAEFEGLVEVSIATPTLKTGGTGYIKGGHFKLLPSSAITVQEGVEGYPIINFEKKNITILAPKDKYYLEMSLAQFETTIDKAKVKIKASGKTATLVGHVAEEWILDDPAIPYSLSLWVTRDFSVGFNIFISLQKTSPDEGLTLGRMGKELFAQGYFPLKAQAVNAKGEVLLDWAVMKIEAKSLDDKEFAIPEGYVKMSEFLKKNKKPKGR